jgi:hypothetical protein
VVVRMRETRVMVSGLHSIDVLRSGVEYDLPSAFGAFLVCEGKADWRPGRLAKFAPDQIRVPVRKQPVRLSKVLTLED